MAFLDKTGLVRLWEHINSKIENKVEKEADKGLILTSEAERLSTVITGLEITDDVENLEGVNIIQNAHTLGGIAADQYALKSDLENLPDSNIGTITNINGIEPDENGTVILHANDVKAVTINLEETNEGEPALTNADMLGGITADQYALKEDIARDYALKFDMWSDEEKTSLAEYVIGTITQARGVSF